MSVRFREKHLPSTVCAADPGYGVTAPSSVITSPTYICFTAAQCESAGRRQLASNSGAIIYREDDEAAKQQYMDPILERCGDYGYEGYLHVGTGGHIYTIAMPGKDVTGCPAMAAHAILSWTGEHEPYKELMIWETVKEGEAFFSAGKLHVGSWKAGNMVGAVNQASPAAPGNHVYDVLGNNCATFPLNLAKVLDVEVDQRMVSFLARRLVEESGKSLADSIRGSLNFGSLFKGRNLRGTEPDISDERLIELAVERGATV